MLDESKLNTIDDSVAPVPLSMESTPVINYALQQRGIPVISEVRVCNNTECSYSNLAIDIEFSPAFAVQEQNIMFDLSSGDEFVLRKIPININGDFLASLTERVSGKIVITCRNDKEVLYKLEQDIAILAFDECFGFWFMPELLSCFSQPNHPDIPKILLNASKLLGEWTKSPALDAYQSEDPNRVRMQAAAIYGALQQCNINYAVAPAGFEKNGQRVRTADVILKDHLANCLDISLLYIACLEAAGLNPILVLVEGHAFPGVWLSDECFPETVQDEPTAISKRAATGIGNICLIETTMLCAGQQVDFASAQQEGEKNLITKPFRMSIDIQRARALGVRPLPRRELRESGYKIVHEERKKEELTAKPGELGVIYTELSDQKQPLTKFDIWQRKLLDLTKRNALINLRLTRNMLPVLTSSLSKLEDALFEKQDFRLLPKSDDWKINIEDDNLFELVSRLTAYDQALQLDFINGDIRIPYTAGEVAKSVTQLYRKSRSDMEENGANTLYLALGALKWYETEHSARAFYAPIILIPVDIIRKSARVGYVIRRRDDDAQLNITLLEMLRQNYNTEVKGLDPLPADEHGVDITKILSIMRHEIMHKSRWDIVESAFLGNFSFAQFVMWNDLRNRSEELKENKIVRSLETGQLCWKPDNLSETICEKDIMVPIVADSSQLKAIDAAAKDNSFVLHGPPGTGKSQTITSMVANAVANGKTVLFVAQKMAALSVVKKRLDRIGIGPFCLELHSNKSNKKSVLDQLETVLKLAGSVQKSEYAQIADSIAKLTSELDSHKQALHKVYPFGASLYEAISRYELYTYTSDNITFSIEDIKAMSSEQIKSNEMMVDELVSVARVIGHPHQHLLDGIGMVNYTQQSRVEAESAIDALITSLNSIQEIAVLFSSKQGLSFPESLKELNELYSLANKILAVSENVEKRKSLESSLCNAFDYAVVELPVQELIQIWRTGYNTWFIPRFFAHRKVKSRIVPFFKRGKLEKAQVMECLELLNERMDIITECNLMTAELPKLIKDNYEDYFMLANDFKTAYDELMSRYEIINGILQPTQDLFSFDFIETILTRVKTWKNNIMSLRDYVVWNYTKIRAASSGLEPLVVALEKGLSLNDAKASYFKALYRAMAEYIFAVDANNSRFNGILFEEKVKSFKHLNDELETQTQQEILLRLSAKLPNLQTLASQNSELGILQRAIKSGGRGIAIRKLLEQLPTLLPKLCPCMLMSPISAAQYLDPKRVPFDIVIFDEASQMPTCEAVGVLARAKEAVIVGDPKQMPPTSFFASNNIDEEHPELEDMESILDDCLALSMPETNLKWHYRSRHESLIAFSNREYYENSLYTFPSPDALCSKVRLTSVEGFYDRGKTRQNRAEAEAIVKEIEQRLENSNQSIGVVTFSVVQQSLVEDLLHELFVLRPELDALANDVEEPLFVKNLENVQGDERDIILFSVCYGPDKDGGITMNFGPLNRAGGWRRLNVAITRAREEMMIFSVLKYDQIDITRSNADGVRGLKSFLEYAQNNTEATNKSKKLYKDGIAASIVHKLQSKGYKADISVGFSQFRVDVGVLSSENDNKYTLGILLDGNSYAQADTVHDRELAVTSVLSGLGWNVLRIYAIDWWENADREIERIIKALQEKDEPVDLKPTVEVTTIPSTKEEDCTEVIVDNSTTVNNNPNMQIYEATELPYMEISSDVFMNLSNHIIKEYCEKVLAMEAPIAESLLVKRILSAFGISRASSRVTSKVTTITRSLGIPLVKELTALVYYTTDPQDYKLFRISEGKDSKRDVKELPIVEVMNAINTVLNQQYGLPENDLVRETAKLLGYTRVGSYVDIIMREGIEQLIQTKKIIKSDSGNIMVNLS